MSDYLPIACGLHSEYELLAMHRQSVELCCANEQGSDRVLIGVVDDVFTRGGGEYLRLGQRDGSSVDIRLDHIRKIVTK